MTGADLSSPAGLNDSPDGPPLALSIRRLSKSFAGAVALREVDLNVRAGEVHALVGENGSGKSTLIKVLSGYHVPDDGADIRVAGRALAHGNPEASHRAGCRFVHQDLGLVDTMSVADNLTLGVGYPVRFGAIRSKAWRAEAAAALSMLELDVDPDELVGKLSPAAKTGVALARALHDDKHGEPSVLVLDEPTASLPAPQVGQLYRTVRAVTARGIGVLYVSHHLQEIFDLADRVTVFRDGSRVATRVTSELDRRTLAHLIVGDEQDHLPEKNRATSQRDRVLCVTGLSCNALRDLDLSADAGEIVGIAGITGSGRENVLPSIFGASPRDGGTVEVAGERLKPADPRAAMRSGIGYLPSDRKINGGVMTQSARENFAITNLGEFWRFPTLRGKRERAAAQDWFGRLDVRPDGNVDRALQTFSGGNQQKILLTKWLRRNPRVLLLEEPTQGVDIAAKALLHRHVAAAALAGACVVISSADNEELAGLCDRVIVLNQGVRRTELSGSALTPTALTHAVLGLEKDHIA